MTNFEDAESRKILQDKIEKDRKSANKKVLNDYRILGKKPAQNASTPTNKKLAVNPKTGKICSESDLEKKDCPVIDLFTKKVLSNKEEEVL